MVFNWFRRQFNDRDREQPPAPEETTERAGESGEAPADAGKPEPSEPEASESEDTGEPATDAAPAATDDYLQWAKAAYQNIQKQRQAESPEVPAAPAEPPTAETETETVEYVESPDSAAEASVADAIASDVEIDREIEPNPPEPTPDTKPTVSLLDRAEAEREERLARLESEAIETAVEQEEVPDLSFDDDFVWSAEVLAAQGRRPEDVSAEEIAWLQKLRRGLSKTRIGLVNQLKAIVGQGPLNEEAVMEIEALLLQADVGVEATDFIIESLQSKLREEALPPDEAIAYLKQILRDILDKPLKKGFDADFVPEPDRLNIWLIAGVNGAGKTTTIGKLAHMAKQSNYPCTIAAADTFRAAAVEQVKIWGQRSGTEVIANPGKNTDPASVVFDAIGAAQARKSQLLLVDTAGRLQNKKNLMDELAKIRRIIDKKAPDAVVESLLVLDATLGQNGLRQAQVFSEAVQLSGAILTKLDGTAKGGVALAVAQQLELPIRFIGAGEGIEDLRPFSSYEFIEALLNG